MGFLVVFSTKGAKIKNKVLEYQNNTLSYYITVINYKL